MTRVTAPPTNSTRPGGPTTLRLIAALLWSTAALSVATTPLEAQTIEYLLGGASQVTRICPSCEGGRDAPEELHGKFDLTVMPIPDAHTIEAVTAIHWHSKSFRIAGAGFLERLGPNRLSMVVDAVVDDQSVLLTSTTHPTESDGTLRLSLTTSPDSPVAISIELVAFANTTDGPDADGDGIPDVLDLCPQNADSDQEDSDLDGIGNPCDSCPGTELGEPVLESGCSLAQTCPCVGPQPETPWKDQRAYLTCVARTLKVLVGAEEITRAQARSQIQAAARSGCGTPVIAMLAR